MMITTLYFVEWSEDGETWKMYDRQFASQEAAEDFANKLPNHRVVKFERSL